MEHEDLVLAHHTLAAMHTELHKAHLALKSEHEALKTKHEEDHARIDHLAKHWHGHTDPEGPKHEGHEA